jgi:hypothetical protein
MRECSWADRTRRDYERLIGPLRATARSLGYALAVHGTLSYDIDLVAIPWTADAVSARDLAEAIQKCAAVNNGGIAIDTDRDLASNPSYFEHGCPGSKPHGRRTWAFHLGGGPYIDLSVMPRLEPIYQRVLCPPGPADPIPVKDSK